MSVLFDWRRAVLDSELPAPCRHVLLTLSMHMDESGGSCWPSTETLARESGLHRATVIRHLATAECAGWFERKASRGRTSNVYQATQPSPPTTVEPSQKTTVAENDRRTELSQPSHTTTQPSFSARQPSHKATQGRQEGVHEVVIESVTAALVLVDVAPDRFAEFYASYPRKTKRPNAESAWKTRVTKRKVDPQVVLDGLGRWIVYWNLDGTEQRFIPHPSSFLNSEQWDDTPPPVRQRTSARSAQNATARSSVLDALYTTPARLS